MSVDRRALESSDEDTSDQNAEGGDSAERTHSESTTRGRSETSIGSTCRVVNSCSGPVNASKKKGSKHNEERHTRSTRSMG